MIRSPLCLCLVALMFCVMAPLASAMNLHGTGKLVDPPVVLSNLSHQSVLVRWQTSLPGVAAAPVEHHLLAPGAREEHINHANFWITEDEPEGEDHGVTNMIEVWVYSEDNPDLLVSSFVTYRDLYAADFANLDKSVVLEITISETTGIDVKLE